MKYQITSSKDAQKRSDALKSVWSAESQLTQKILIYVASLLEEIVENTRRKNRKPRKKSAWNAFLGEKMKEGLTITEASKLYKGESKPNRQ